MNILRLTNRDDVGVAEGPAYEYNCEDGVGTRFDYFVEVLTEAQSALVRAGKRSSVHRLVHAFRWRRDADAMVAAIQARGWLNLDHWSTNETWPLEEKWAAYADQEAEVAHGHRAAHDLYHGIPL
jgi:hypothetical protein